MIDETWKSWLDAKGNVRAAVKGDRGRVEVVAVECSLEPDEALDFADAVAEAGAIQGTMLGGMGPDDKGGWTVQMQPSPGLTRRMVDFLCEWLGPVENYTETRAELPFDLPAGVDKMQHSPKPAGQLFPYVLTVERAGGKTPHEKRIEAENERDQLQELVPVLAEFEQEIDPEDGPLPFARATLDMEVLEKLRRLVGVDEQMEPPISGL